MGPPLSLLLNSEALKPLIRQIVEEVVAALEEDRSKFDGELLAFSEEKAARLLGLESHVLRDERRRGRIQASSIVGRRIRYTRADLMNYLQGRRAIAEEV